MKKQNKNILLGIILVGLVLIGLSSQGIINLPLSLGSGFTTLGLNNVQFSSNDPTIGGQAWVLTVSQNGGGQSAYSGSGTISDGSKSSDSFSISVSLDKNYATYPIYNQGVSIKSVQYIKATFNPFSSTGGCNSDVWDNWYHPSQLAVLGDVYCYNFINKGVYGTLKTPGDLNFQSTISVNGKSGSDKITISNSGQSSGISNNGNVYASWFGSFNSGESTPSPTGQGIIAVYDTNTGGWKTASQTSYNSWYSYNSAGLNNCLSSSGSNGGTCFDTYNNYERTLMNGKTFTSTGGDVATTSGSQSNGLVTLNLPKQLEFPGITMRIKASFIGINIPVGEPKILSGSSLTFQTGQTGTISVNVENVGDGDGSFDVYATCSDGFSQTGNALRISGLSPGTNQIVYIPISSNVVSGTKSGSCVVTARDINNPNNYDTKTISVSSSSISICSDGQQSVIGDRIQECKNNQWITIQTCGSGEKAEIGNDGIAKCVSSSSDNSQGFFSKIFNGIKDFFKGIFNFTGGIYSLLKNVLVFIVLIFSTLFGYEFLSEMKSLKRKKWLALLISILIALSIGLLTYRLFWVGIITFLIWVAYRLVIGNKITAVRKGIRRIRDG